MELVIDCKPNGSVEAMYCDSFQLGFLGQQDISRASEILFNKDTQLWDVYVVTDEGLATAEDAKDFQSYEEARDVEVRWFNEARKKGVLPLSEEGLRELKHAINCKSTPTP